MKKKGFTLIELIAVLVILAILALIVTPLVMNIIRKARLAADKRSIDSYGRSIELAIANYLLDTGNFPSDVSQLTVEYSGDEVVCTTTQLNSNSSVYLAGCTVGGRSVDYTYGKKEAITYNVYSVGDSVTYNNVDYYVIADSDETDSTVTLLKAEPLTVEEVNFYGGVGTENNHVNMYNTNSSNSYYRTAYNQNGYGGMAYYTSANCGYGQDSNSITSDCTTDYEQSDVKYVVDAWKSAQAPLASEARLITYNEHISNCIEKEFQTSPSGVSIGYVPQYDWLYDNNYYYWTMSAYNDSSQIVWFVSNSGSIGAVYTIWNFNIVVRPVIVIDKSLL